MASAAATAPVAVDGALRTRVADLVQRSQALFDDAYPCTATGLDVAGGRQLRARLRVAVEYTVPETMRILPPAVRDSALGKATAGGPLLLTTGSSAQGSDSGADLDIGESKSAGPLQAGQVVPYSSAETLKQSSALVARRAPPKVPEPQWHAPWELSAVVSGHLGWVRCLAFDPSNEWFVTGSADRTIKIWDLAKCCAGAEGGLKLTLTGHISAVRGLAVSSRSPYLFSCGEDKQIKCWDLEYNKVIRHYHGHLSGVMCMALHPTLDLLITGGRDSVARVWDIRSKHQVHLLGGHEGAVGSLFTSGVDPQVTTASYDSTIRLWDLAAGRSMTTLTHHKKSVRAIVPNQKELSFVSGAADNIKKWQGRDGKFLMNITGHNSVINCLAVNDDNVLVSAGDNGSMHFWDYETGYCFQRTKTIVQPGSLEAEAGVYAMSFDLSGSRLITCEADKSIKIWRESAEASEETHPIDMAGWSKQCLALKRF